MTDCFVAAREFAKAASGEDRRVSRLEILVNNQATVVDESVAMNRMEHIFIHVPVAGCDEDPAFNFHFILLSLFLLLD